MAADGDLLEFPCEFPVKVLGMRSDDFAQTVVDIVLRHAPDFAADGVEMRVSRGGRYLSVTCTVHAVSRAQLDGLYRDLTAHPAVRMVL